MYNLDMSKFAKLKKLPPAIFLSIPISVLISAYLAIIEERVALTANIGAFALLKTVVLNISIPNIIFFFLLAFFLLVIFFNYKTHFRFLYKYRYLFALLLLVCLVFLQIHGSHISLLSISGEHQPLLGIARGIRSDELNVNTPFALSQYCNNFSYFSDIARASTTDMFMTYGQPVWDIAVIFRPFHWGYLFLPQAYGLSFYWISRLIALALVSFEFGRLLTNNNKKLALAYALLMVLSPVVQFWFAINMLVEMLFFGQLAIVLVNYYLTNPSLPKKIACCTVLTICAGGFALANYPAWEVPLAYVFLCLLV